MSVAPQMSRLPCLVIYCHAYLNISPKNFPGHYPPSELFTRFNSTFTAWSCPHSFRSSTRPVPRRSISQDFGGVRKIDSACEVYLAANFLAPQLLCMNLLLSRLVCKLHSFKSVVMHSAVGIYALQHILFLTAALPSIPATFRPRDAVDLHLIPNTSSVHQWLCREDAFFSGPSKHLTGMTSLPSCCRHCTFPPKKAASHGSIFQCHRMMYPQPLD